MIDPEDCATMTQVRTGVDETDRALSRLLARRFGYMDAAARIKPERGQVRDDVRKKQVIANIAAHAAADQFVTALLGRIDLRSGGLELVNAGHMNPLLVRDGQVSEIPLDAGLVLGVAPDETYGLQRFQLHPGDRLALVTDGMFERDAAEAEIEKLLATLGHLHPRETVQVLTRAVLDVAGGAVRDDATVLIVDWHGSSASSPTRLPTSTATETAAEPAT